MSTVPRLGSTTMALANHHVKIQDDINTGILTCLLCHGFSLVKAANCSSTKDQETSWLLRICLKAADCPAVSFRWYQLSTVLSVTKKEVKEKRLPNTLGNLLPLDSCAVWSPYIRKDISRVEMVQRRAARFVLQNYRRRASVSSMLQELEWDTLEKRRQAASLVLMYKIHSETVAINPADYITPRTPAVTRNYHPYQYQIIPARIQLYQNSFFPRTVIWWNALPVSVVISPSVEVFREAVTSCI